MATEHKMTITVVVKSQILAPIAKRMSVTLSLSNEMLKLGYTTGEFCLKEARLLETKREKTNRESLSCSAEMEIMF